MSDITNTIFGIYPVKEALASQVVFDKVFIQKGIDMARISFESFGACCPVEMELINGRDNESGRSKNRRALINITKD